MSAEQPTAQPLTVMLYSDDRSVRQQVRLALGKRVAADLPELTIVETATQAALIKAADGGDIDLFILDGEAVPAGGIGMVHQLKNEIPNCAPCVLLLARQADAWLASWSRAEGISSFPVDPIRLPATVADVLRRTRAQQTAAS